MPDPNQLSSSITPELEGRGGYLVVRTGPVWRILDLWAERPRTCVQTRASRFLADLWITENTVFGGRTDA